MLKILLDKKNIIFAGLVMLVALVSVYLFLSKKNSNLADLKNIRPTPTSEWTLVIVTPPGQTESGGNGEGFRQMIEENPQLQVEANLRQEVPIRQEKFTIDFSYKEDKFTVVLDPKFSDARISFEKWAREQGITDFSSFEIK